MNEPSESPKADEPSGVISLQRLNARLKRLVEEQTEAKKIRVQGMAWDVRRTQSGHVRFRLRHDKYSLPCIVFQGLARRLPFRIDDGQQLIVQGRIEVYEIWGELQLVARAVKLDRSAEERETLSSLKARAQAEGWLDKQKRALPRQPKRIGLITGGDSRARADVRGSLRDAGIESPVVVETVNMEGPDVAQEIRSALDALNKQSEVDAIVIARGGGSKRVLGALNDWELAEEIRHSRAPVMTAIGHRQDETLADFAADARAHTPSLVGTVMAGEQTTERNPALTVVLAVVVVIIVFIAIARSQGWL